MATSSTLGELVLTDHAARVLARRAGLGAIARRAGDAADGQIVLGEDAPAREIGQRNLGGRDQPVSVLGAEQIAGELGQLARAVGRGIAHQARGFGLAVAELLRLDVEHEVGEGPFETRQTALEDDEARARDAHRGLEIHHAERRAQVDVVPRVEIEPGRFADPPHLHVRRLVETVGRVVRRQVGQRRQQLFDLGVEAALFRLAVADQVLELADLRHQCARLLAPSPGRADLLGQPVAPVLGLLDLRPRRASALIKVEHVRRDGIEATPRESGVERFRVFANPPDVVHETSVSACHRFGALLYVRRRRGVQSLSWFGPRRNRFRRPPWRPPPRASSRPCARTGSRPRRAR